MIRLPVSEEDYCYVERVVVRGLTFAPDGRTLVALLGTPEACVHIVWWDLERDAERETLDGGLLTNDGSDRWADPALSADHRFLARSVSSRHASAEGAILTDRTASPFDRRTLAWRSDEPSRVWFLRFSPDRRFLFAAGVATDTSDGEWEPREVVAWWDIAALPARHPPGVSYHSFEASGLLPVGATRGVTTSLEVTAGGSGLAAGGDGWLRVYRFDGVRLSPAWSAEGTGAEARRLAFSPDGAWLAAAAGGEVLVHDATGGELRGAAKFDAGDVNALAFSPSGRILATACGDGVVRFHRSPGGAPFRQFICDLGPASAVAFSPDGCVCAAGGEGGRVALWDVDD